MNSYILVLIKSVRLITYCCFLSITITCSVLGCQVSQLVFSPEPLLYPCSLTNSLSPHSYPMRQLWDCFTPKSLWLPFCGSYLKNNIYILAVNMPWTPVKLPKPSLRFADADYAAGVIRSSHEDDPFPITLGCGPGSTFAHGSFLPGNAFRFLVRCVLLCCPAQVTG